MRVANVMSLIAFGFQPIFFSTIAFVILLRGRYTAYKKSIKLFMSIPLSFFICFLYPLTKVYVTHSYTFFDGFYLFCFISSLVAVAINVIVFLINGVINERT